MSALPEPQTKIWRLIVFAVFALLAIALFTVMFGGAPSLLEPWVVLQTASKTYHPEIHRWHDAVWGALTTFLFAGTLLSLLWGGQKRPLLAQFFVLGMFLFTISPLPFPGGFDPMQVIPQVIVTLLFIATYPNKRALFSLSSERSLSIPLLVISVLVLIAIAPDVWRNIGWQIADHVSEHGVGFHWLTSAFVDTLLVIGGFLVATRRPGWKALGIIVGIALLYLGMAAIRVPDHAGSWGVIGGVLSIIGGLSYIVATIYERRKSSAAVVSAAVTPETVETQA
jgi:hypothetical protein